MSAGKLDRESDDDPRERVSSTNRASGMFTRARPRTATSPRDAAQQLGIAAGTHFHLLSFEGPDPYARIGGLETRVSGLCQALVAAGVETHLWFVGDPNAPGHELRDGVHLHRWCQWQSRHHPVGVYDGQDAKVPEYTASLPPVLFREYLAPHFARGGRAVVLAEEWQTANSVLHLNDVLVCAGARDRVRMFWNANNVFGFEGIDWHRMRSAATVTTVSRYMRQIMQGAGVESVVIPNGLSPDVYLPPDRSAVNNLRRNFEGRLAITKMARWDPDKNWLASVQIVAALKRDGHKPLLIARGGREAYGREVLAAMHGAGLRVVDRSNHRGDMKGLVSSLADVGGADVLHLTSHVDPDGRRALFRASDVVLANSSKEPFGLVGLEAMAVGGIACTGCTGEDYAVPGRNALVLQTTHPSEFVALFSQLRGDADEAAAMRRAGRLTARQYAWPEVIRTMLAPRLGLSTQAFDLPG
jgi:glycosyltransferase involved in cell wall biosynthesis